MHACWKDKVSSAVGLFKAKVLRSYGILPLREVKPHRRPLGTTLTPKLRAMFEASLRAASSSSVRCGKTFTDPEVNRASSRESLASREGQARVRRVS